MRNIDTLSKADCFRISIIMDSLIDAFKLIKPVNRYDEGGGLRLINYSIILHYNNSEFFSLFCQKKTNNLYYNI